MVWDSFKKMFGFKKKDDNLRLKLKNMSKNEIKRIVLDRIKDLSNKFKLENKCNDLIWGRCG